MFAERTYYNVFKGDFMSSRETLATAFNLINSALSRQMQQALDELQMQDGTLRNGTKSAGPRARKASNEWGKGVSNRLKELREAKKLLSQYRKETIAEAKNG